MKPDEGRRPAAGRGRGRDKGSEHDEREAEAEAASEQDSQEQPEAEPRFHLSHTDESWFAHPNAGLQVCKGALVCVPLAHRRELVCTPLPHIRACVHKSVPDMGIGHASSTHALQHMRFNTCASTLPLQDSRKTTNKLSC